MTSRLPELLTAQEVAEFARVRERTIYQMAKDGRLKGHKVGRGWRFYREDVLEVVGGER